MNLRMVAPVLALSVAVALGGCANSNADLEQRVADLESRVQALEEPTNTDNSGQGSETPSSSTCSVTIGDVSFDTKAYGDERVIIVPMTFTNNGDEAASFIPSVTVDLYQDGAKLDSAMPSSWGTNLPQEWEDQSTKITPGTSINVVYAWELRSFSPIDIKITDTQTHEVLATKTVDAG